MADDHTLQTYESVLTEVSDPVRAPDFSPCGSRSDPGASMIISGPMPLPRRARPRSAPARPCSTTTGVILLPRCRRSSRSAMRSLSPDGPRRLPASAVTSASTRDGSSSSFCPRPSPTAGRGRAVRRHAAVSAAGRRAPQSPTAPADGAERAGDEPASRPARTAGAADRRGRQTTQIVVVSHST